jgi:hypothetical protein
MNPQHIDPSQVAFLMSFIAIIGVIFTVVMVIPFWFIFKKAGFSPWLSLLMLVPLASIIILYVIAFSEWKVVPVASAMPPGYPPQGYQPIPPRV